MQLCEQNSKNLIRIQYQRNVGAFLESSKKYENAHTIGYGGTSAYTFHYIIKAVVYTKSIYIISKGLLPYLYYHYKSISQI